MLGDYAWPEINIYLVYPPNRRLTARTRAFSEAVIAMMRNSSNSDES